MRPIFQCLFVITVLLSSPAFAQISDLPARMVQGEDLLLANNYPAALALFQKIAQDFPQSPAGSFGEMALWQNRMFENRDFRFVAQYKAAEKQMLNLCEQRLAENRPADWDIFTCAAGYGMKGFFDARQDKWLQGIGDAQLAVRNFKRLIWLNPQFVDAEMGIGVYEFWRSVVTLKLKWLPFFSDQRAAGMAKVERAAREGKYIVPLAKANLAFMAAELKQYDKALTYLKELQTQYPKNVLFRQAEGEIAWEQKRYGDCVKIFSGLLKQDPSISRNLYWLAACRVMPYLAAGTDGKPKGEAPHIPAAVAVQAQAELKQYLGTQPIPIWAAGSHYWLGLIAEWQGDMATAQLEYAETLKLDPKAKDVRKRLQRN